MFVSSRQNRPFRLYVCTKLRPKNTAGTAAKKNRSDAASSGGNSVTLILMTVAAVAAVIGLWPRLKELL